MDNTLMINEFVDFNELHELLNEEKENVGVYFVIGNESGLSGSYGSNMMATQINNGELMNVKLTDEENVKKWRKRKRYEKGSVDASRMRELHKIINRETAARAFAQKNVA
ncbi:hypothetical protein CRYUN_Cryun14cG0082500 [Craigia yunnanensis]